MTEPTGPAPTTSEQVPKIVGVRANVSYDIRMSDLQAYIPKDDCDDHDPS